MLMRDARSFARSRASLARRPAAGRPRGMAWMDRVREQHGFIVRQGIQELIVALDKRLLSPRRACAGSRRACGIGDPGDAKARSVPTGFPIRGPIPSRSRRRSGVSTRQRRANPRLQIILLLHTQIACAPAGIEAGNALNSALLEELAPAADRVVVEQKRMGGLLTAPPLVQKHQGIRTPRHPARRRRIAG